MTKLTTLVLADSNKKITVSDAHVMAVIEETDRDVCLVVLSDGLAYGVKEKREEVVALLLS